MDIKFEKTGDARGVIEVSITEADYTAKVDKELKEYGKTHVIPGFRKGHIALPELRKRFGRAIKSDVINDVVINGVFNYIRENNIRVLGQPIPADSKEIDMKESDYTFKYDVAIWPELNIVIDKSVTLPYYNIEVTDKMVEEQSNSLRERFGTQGPGEEADERALVKGVLMEVGEDGSVLTEEGAIQNLNAIVAPFLFADKDQAAKFLGKHVGDKVVFNPATASGGNAAEIASMLNIDKEKAADVKSDFELAISEIIVAKPAELNQEYFDNVFGPDKVHNEEEYNAEVRKMIAASLVPNSIQLFNRDAHNYLVEKYSDMTLDAELLKSFLRSQDKNLTDENIDAEYDQMLPGIKWEIISGEVSNKLGVKIEEADLMARATFIARQHLQQYGMYNADEETVKDIANRILSDRSMRNRIDSECEELKMFSLLREAVTLDQKTVTIEEFAKLANPEAEENKGAEE